MAVSSCHAAFIAAASASLAGVLRAPISLVPERAYLPPLQGSGEEATQQVSGSRKPGLQGPRLPSPTLARPRAGTQRPWGALCTPAPAGSQVLGDDRCSVLIS